MRCRRISRLGQRSPRNVGLQCLAQIEMSHGVPFRNGWRIPFGGVQGTIATLFTDPMALLKYFVSDSRPFYVLQLVAPVAFGFIVFPEVAAIAGLVIFTNIFSNFGTSTILSITTHLWWYQF